MIRDKPYYSMRTGKHPSGARPDLAMLKKLFLNLFQELAEDGHFQEFFGYHCVDAGHVDGKAGSDLNAFFFRKLRKENLWPIPKAIDSFSEDDLFDVIELLHDCASAGVGGRFHDYANCGMHYSEFDPDGGRAHFRRSINEILGDYDQGYQVSEAGEIVRLLDPDVRALSETPLPTTDSINVDSRVLAATEKFRSRHSSWEDRRDAVRDLADVLEFLRPKLKLALLHKDEQDLFAIANNFGLRHHNQKQKTQYDKAIWYSWLFHYYLATIHASVRLIKKQREESS